MEWTITAASVGNYVIIFLALATVVGHLAVLNSPDYPEENVVVCIRRIKIMSWGLFAAKLVYDLEWGRGYGLTSELLLPVILILVSDTYSVWYRLMAEDFGRCSEKG